jgi:hypothetical protein
MYVLVFAPFSPSSSPSSFSSQSSSSCSSSSFPISFSSFFPSAALFRCSAASIARISSRLRRRKPVPINNSRNSQPGNVQHRYHNASRPRADVIHRGHSVDEVVDRHHHAPSRIPMGDPRPDGRHTSVHDNEACEFRDDQFCRSTARRVLSIPVRPIETPSSKSGQ